MAELRMAALAEVLKAGIDASKDISWQIRCGNAQDLAFARVSRAVRLTVLLSAKLEADPGLETFGKRVQAAGSVAHAPVGGLGAALPAAAVRAAAPKAPAGGEIWDRETLDAPDAEPDHELDRELHDDRPPAEILGEACRLIGITTDLSAFETPAETAPPDGAPPPMAPERRSQRTAAMQAWLQGAERQRDAAGRAAAGGAGRDPPDG
jgi:hypothetical protein